MNPLATNVVDSAGSVSPLISLDDRDEEEEEEKVYFSPSQFTIFLNTTHMNNNKVDCDVLAASRIETTASVVSLAA